MSAPWRALQHSPRVVVVYFYRCEGFWARDHESGWRLGAFYLFIWVFFVGLR